MKNVVLLLTVMIQNTIMLSVVMTSVMAPFLISGVYYKCFTIVIYDRNDSGQYNKTMIIVEASLS